MDRIEAATCGPRAALPERQRQGPHERGRAGPGSRRSASAPRRAPDPSARRLDRLTILVLEDHVDSREMLRQMLEDLGATVLSAGDGWEGLLVLRAERPDVILCDLLMPAMDGFAFIAALRRDPRWRRTAVVAVTALGGDADYRRTWEAGFDAHLTKPVRPDQLTAVIRAVLRSPPG
jgi:CheY-like chemotaxis protein